MDIIILEILSGAISTNGGYYKMGYLKVNKR